MLKKLLTATGIVGVLTVGAIIGSLTLMPVFAHPTDTNPPAQATVQSAEDDDVTEAAVKGPDTDDIELEEQVGDQSELDDDADEAKGQEADIDDVQEQVEEEGGVED